MGSHSVTCHPAEVTFPPLPQPKLVLDLATPEGCKAELTCSVCISAGHEHEHCKNGRTDRDVCVRCGSVRETCETTQINVKSRFWTLKEKR